MFIGAHCLEKYSNSYNLVEELYNTLNHTQQVLGILVTEEALWIFDTTALLFYFVLFESLPYVLRLYLVLIWTEYSQHSSLQSTPYSEASETFFIHIWTASITAFPYSMSWCVYSVHTNTHIFCTAFPFLMTPLSSYPLTLQHFYLVAHGRTWLKLYWKQTFPHA